MFYVYLLMAFIQTLQGDTVLFDDADESIVRNYEWRSSIIKRSSGRSYVYASTRGVNKMFMHRFLMNCSDPNIFVDHINGNGLDNRRSNLRLCNRSQNSANRQSSFKSSSKYLGVCKKRKNWRAQISVNKRTKYLGTFKTQEEAALAYNEAAKKIHGEFANLNVL